MPEGPSPRLSRAAVFDLDDTLFDALAQCVRPAQREAAEAMVAAGLRAQPGAVHALRLALQGRGVDVDAEVARAFPCDDADAVCAAGRRAFFERDPGPLRPFPWTEEVLRATRARAVTILLSAGSPPAQREKLRRLGLEPHFDEQLYVDPLRGETKRTALARWMAFRGLSPGRVLVVGDRPDAEIAAALTLGCAALRIRGGEWAAQPAPPGVPQAEDLRAVLRIVASWT